MEIWGQLGVAALVVRWGLAVLVLLVGLGLLAGARLRILGGAMTVLSLGVMGYWYFTPERLALQKAANPDATAQGPAPAVADERPPVLVIHGFGSGPPDRDALTLAETGLFRVLLAGPGESDAPSGEIVVEDRPDCVERRTRQEGPAAPGAAGLVFSARTGFRRCGSLVAGPSDLPGHRADLWKYNAPGEPLPDYDGNGGLRGVMVLRLSRGPESKVVARREARARPVAGSAARSGAYGYDERPEHSLVTSWSSYDPDAVGFVLETFGVDPSDLPAAGKATPSELSEVAPGFVARARDESARLVVAASLVGGAAPLEGGAGAVARALGPAITGTGRVLAVRYRSECPVAQAVMSLGKMFSEACGREPAGRRAPDCVPPIRQDEYLERCTVGARSVVWDSEDAGRRTVVWGGETGEVSDVYIRQGARKAGVRRVHVERSDGPLDIAALGKGPSVWHFTGATECVERLTVVGQMVGVVGIDPERVRFRFRRSALDSFTPKSTEVAPLGWTREPPVKAAEQTELNPNQLDMLGKPRKGS